MLDMKLEITMNMMRIQKYRIQNFIRHDNNDSIYKVWLHDGLFQKMNKTTI